MFTIVFIFIAIIIILTLVDKITNQKYKIIKNIVKILLAIYFITIFGFIFINWIQNILKIDNFKNKLREYEDNTTVYIDGLKAVKPKKFVKKLLEIKTSHAHGAGKLKEKKHIVILSKKEHNITILLDRDSKWKWEYSFYILEPQKRYIGIIRNIFPIEVYKDSQKILIKE